MKVSEKTIYYFALVKGYLVPSLIVHNKDPEKETSNEMMFFSLDRSFIILSRVALENGCSFEQAMNECFTYFNKPEILTDAFIKHFKTDSFTKDVVDEVGVETKLLLKIEVSDSVLSFIKELLLLLKSKVY